MEAPCRGRAYRGDSVFRSGVAGDDALPARRQPDVGSGGAFLPLLDCARTTDPRIRHVRAFSGSRVAHSVTSRLPSRSEFHKPSRRARRRAQNSINLHCRRAAALRISQTFTADASQHPEPRNPSPPPRRHAQNFAFLHVLRVAALRISHSFTAHSLLDSLDAQPVEVRENPLHKRKKLR
jgi:hypothetical protein